LKEGSGTTIPFLVVVVELLLPALLLLITCMATTYRCAAEHEIQPVQCDHNGLPDALEGCIGASMLTIHAMRGPVPTREGQIKRH
jgi:hypothetical protein